MARYKITLKEANENLKKRYGYTIVGTNWVDRETPIEIKCKCGNIFVADYAKTVKRGTGCQECQKRNRASSHQKYSVEYVDKECKRRGITLLNKEEYKTIRSDLSCLCTNCGHKFTTRFEFLLSRTKHKKYCDQCARRGNFGRKNGNYAKGNTTIIEHCRKLVRKWARSIAKKYNNTCYVTGEKEGLIVHHFQSFKSILKENCKKLNIDLKETISEYSQSTLKKLDDIILKYHTPDTGVLLSAKVHRAFHHEYGQRNNSKEQFNEFLEKYYPNVKKFD